MSASSSFKIGDTVEITRANAPQKGMIGIITRLRVPGEWYVEMENKLELSWRESSMMIVESTHSLVCRVLGEDYL